MNDEYLRPLDKLREKGRYDSPYMSPHIVGYCSLRDGIRVEMRTLWQTRFFHSRYCGNEIRLSMIY